MHTIAIRKEVVGMMYKVCRADGRVKIRKLQAPGTEGNKRGRQANWALVADVTGAIVKLPDGTGVPVDKADDDMIIEAFRQ